MLVTESGIIIPSRTGIDNVRGMRLRLPEIAERPIPIPYQNQVSLEEHAKIKRDICIYLFDNDIIDLEDVNRLSSLLDRKLNENEWNEISPHPEDYWYILVANQLRDEKSQQITGDNLYNRGVFRERSKQDNYNLNQWVWVGRAIELYPFDHKGKEAGPKEVFSEIVPKIAPVYRAYYDLKTGTGRKVDYLNEEGWRRVALHRRTMGEH